jgi:hypothetical protein
LVLALKNKIAKLEFFYFMSKKQNTESSRKSKKKCLDEPNGQSFFKYFQLIIETIER